MNNTIPVLNHGFVRLVDHMGTDLSVVRAARVSYDAAWRAGEDEGSDGRLIGYLWRNRHTTPFESATFTFEIKAPIFVFRQWHRHRTWSYNELSARYRELPAEFYVPATAVIASQSKTSKQGRGELLVHEEAEQVMNIIANTSKAAFAAYQQILQMGVAKELARSVLPVNTYSHMFATVNLLNLFKFLELRLHTHAQYEIRVYAEAMLELIRPILPVCCEAFRPAGGNIAKL